MKKIKSKLLAYAIIPTIGLGFLGMNVASAHGFFGGFGSMATPDQIATRQQNMFQSEAQLLGISIDEVKNAWAQGKTILQIAQDHGITKEQLQQKIKDSRTEELKTQLQALVDKGVITQAQADQRMQFMEAQIADGASGMGLFGGFHSRHRMLNRRMDSTR